MDIPDHLDCWADRQQLQTIVLHLLENSCVASSQTISPVLIKAREVRRQKQNIVSIEVIDQGPGVDEKIREQIFKPFFSTRVDSTGLGLAIVQQLLQHHNGKISILDRDDAGCVMEICLPLPSP